MAHEAPNSRRVEEHEEALECSFCGREEERVTVLIAGPSAYICSDCVADCAAVIDDEKPETVVVDDLPTPHEIHTALDDYVVGQDRAKRTLAVAVYNHYKRLRYRPRPGEAEVRKSNVLMVGPSGVGKTHLVETLARSLSVPFTVVDATALTEAGYVGDDIDSIAERLLKAADGDAALAGRGIVYLDEVDKLASRGRSPGHNRDVSGEGVQQGLLRLMEGQTATVSGGRDAESVDVAMDQVLFFAGGAFVGLEEVVERRVCQRGVGFVAPVDRSTDSPSLLAERLEPVDLMQFGLIPEFVGRLPVTAVLAPLEQADLVEILKAPKDALVRQFETLFQLEFTDDALAAMASEALARGTGARGLRAVMERTLLDAMFDLPGQSRSHWRVDVCDVLAGRNPAAITVAAQTPMAKGVAAG